MCVYLCEPVHLTPNRTTTRVARCHEEPDGPLAPHWRPDSCSSAAPFWSYQQAQH